MVKLDLTRDYYADLELPPTADVADIKKQFKKLALKYHPDRNPGREAEVNSKFQTIQSAHEVLTNLEQKSKYDTQRSRSRYPAASGMKGNPWQNVSSQFPPPPRRAPTAARPTSNSGASRYTSWVPPSPKTPRDNASDNVRAWDRMRNPQANKQNESSGTPGGQQSRPRRKPADPRTAEAPPPPPRTESQRRKAEASFGNRRTPFVHVEDEPPVTSKNYSTTRQRTNLFSDTPSADSEGTKSRPQSENLDPLSQHFRDTFLDGRQSTPYSSHSGEKTNPFDGAGIGRSGTVRDSSRDARSPANGGRPSGASQRRRSSSLPGDSDNFRQTMRDNIGAKTSGRDSSWFTSSRAGERYTPRNTASKPSSASAPTTNANNSTSSVNTTHATANGDVSSKAKDGPTVYDSTTFISPPAPPAFSTQYGTHPLYSNRSADEGAQRAKKPKHVPFMAEMLARAAPSGDNEGAGKRLNAFESQQHAILHELIKSREGNSEKKSEYSAEIPAPRQHAPPVQQYTDTARACSFSMAVDDDTFTRTTPKRFMRSSADDINTSFVKEEFQDSDWRFQAGGPSEDSFSAAKRQARSRTRNGRGSPLKSNDVRFASRTPSGPTMPEASQEQTGFKPEQWSETIGPQNFVPQPAQRPSVSPTRPVRPLKKTKPVRMTAGTAGLVDEEGSSSEDISRPATSTGYATGAAPVAAGTPSAMDIDTPSPSPNPTPTPQTSNARTIPVEPTKPEWRAGSTTANGVKPTREPAVPPSPLNDNTRGSEDSDGFLNKDLFAEFKNVAPFAPQSSGLGSLNDLKSDLPFESRASTKIPLNKEPAKPIAFPEPPKSPHPPPTLAIPNLKTSAVAWKTYSDAFHKYMNEFADFSARYVDHFAARRRIIEQNRKETGFNWIESRGDAGIREYLHGLEEDRMVRENWMQVCNDHEMCVREFVKYRDKMLE